MTPAAAVDRIVELIDSGLIESERQVASDPVDTCPCDLTDDPECGWDCYCIHHTRDEHPDDPWGIVLAEWGWMTFCAFGQDVHPLYFRARNLCRAVVEETW